MQKSRERAVQVMDGDQFNDIGEVLMGAAQVPGTAGQLRLDHLGKR